ncbi:hypothetical protein NP493_1829g00001 [Ridgeia piscesae]|uniref:Uncharacterized protein n=1 Tax=Ridgeia piscesae TaxID=27915 RepID=A0AAD9JRG7_RIDPI|nr:hypothetical protein NP493_1829g00001 [Ridgeia piscesae]
MKNHKTEEHILVTIHKTTCIVFTSYFLTHSLSDTFSRYIYICGLSETWIYPETFVLILTTAYLSLLTLDPGQLQMAPLVAGFHRERIRSLQYQILKITWPRYKALV